MCVQIVWVAKNGLRGVEIISRLVASWRGAAAAQQIKYSDTGAVPEFLIEVPALPDEITGGAAGTVDEKMCQQPSLLRWELVLASMFKGDTEAHARVLAAFSAENARNIVQMSWPAGWNSSTPTEHDYIAKPHRHNSALGDAWRTGITRLDAAIAEALAVRTGTSIKRVDTTATPAVNPALDVVAAKGSVAWLYAELRDVDITADINKPKVADACASRALSLLNADTQLALLWACEAQEYDAGNETAKWCEAQAHDSCSTRLGRAIRLYSELSTGDYAGHARALLDAKGEESIEQRFRKQRLSVSKNNCPLIGKNSHLEDVPGWGEKFCENMPNKGKTRIQDALSYAVASPKKGKRNDNLQDAWDVVDDGPTQSGAHLGLLAYTLNNCRAPSKKIVSCTATGPGQG